MLGRPGSAGLADALSPEGDELSSRDDISLKTNQRITAKIVVETGSPVLYSVLSAPQVREFLQWAQANGSTDIYKAQRVIVFNGQAFDINDLTQRPFVTGAVRVPYEHGELSDALQPVVRFVEEGIELRLRPLRAGDELVQLACSLTLSSIRDVETVAIPL